ncbi:GNAT family N-acetyltransferase [Sporomusa malonica]|uniref:Ribosomal-protein-alanine N-acetyltransferase n=1 Tax=Sporomusa malonica TaxID=112901 RepID=A0A1W2EDN9_9FIRM|nr:GNAT family N-acetyltransferase [Sporomusa malonica]SMD07864.1 ribosomal-protein-alanine N-acetyltransferase [Sporomusa malonica]
MVELVTTFNKELVQRLVALEADAFGIGGMNEWHLVPLIRHGHVYIIRKNEDIVGAVQYFLDWDRPKKAYMMGVSIAKEHRGMGIGTKFIQDTFEALAQEGIEEVELTVDPENLTAIKIYENKLGFVVTDFRKNEYGEGEDRLVMKTALAKKGVC